MNYLEYVKEVRATVEKYEWIKGELAQDKSGQTCYTHASNCHCLCFIGAMYRVKELQTREHQINCCVHFNELQRLVYAKTGLTVPFFNDDVAQSKQDVLNLLDEIIGELELLPVTNSVN